MAGVCVRAGATSVRTLWGCPSLPGAHVARTPGFPRSAAAVPATTAIPDAGTRWPALLLFSISQGVAERGGFTCTCGPCASPRGGARMRARPGPGHVLVCLRLAALPCSSQTPRRATPVPREGTASPAACPFSDISMDQVLHRSHCLRGRDPRALRGGTHRPEDGRHPMPCLPCFDPPQTQTQEPGLSFPPPGPTHRARPSLRGQGRLGISPARAGQSSVPLAWSLLVPGPHATRSSLPEPRMESRQVARS